MELSKQCCSYEQAKKIKQLGIDQEKSLLLFSEERGNPLFARTTLGYTSFGCEAVDGSPDYWEDADGYEYYSAFTVAELGVMLGCSCNLPYAIGQVGTNDCLWTDDLGGNKVKTEAEARAALLIYFLESLTIDADQCNERLKS